MVKEGSLLVQTAIASSVCNLYSEDRDEFSATTRTEGWTEIWGDEAGLVDADADCWKAEEAAKDLLPTTTDSPQLFPTIPVTLVQYRPAWLEQLVLRIAGIPHVVVNSPYASTESTGPLPFLRDSSQSNPILVGRSHPGMRLRKEEEEDEEEKVDETSNGKNNHTPKKTAQQNSILDYLQTQRQVDLDAHMSTSEQDKTDEIKSKQSLSKLLMLLITTKLERSLMVLRYEDDVAWGQVYRKQCLETSRIHEGSHDYDNSENCNKKWRLPTMRGLYQAWSERVIARKSLRYGGPCPSVEEAKKEARKAYEILEHQLSKRSAETEYLLQTHKPVMVDAVLWAHLADALCDINLVLVLADFPRLVKYFQNMYDTYFASSSDSVVMVGTKDPEAWKVWNKHENFTNPFQQIPLEAVFKSGKDDPKKYKHALELMQSLSVREHDLLETLKVGKAARAQEVALRKVAPKQHATPAPAMPKKDDEKSELSAIEKARRQQQRSDQMWISVVGGAAVVTMIYSVLGQVME